MRAYSVETDAVSLIAAVADACWLVEVFELRRLITKIATRAITIKANNAPSTITAISQSGSDALDMIPSVSTGVIEPKPKVVTFKVFDTEAIVLVVVVVEIAVVSEATGASVLPCTVT